MKSMAVFSENKKMYVGRSLGVIAPFRNNQYLLIMMEISEPIQSIRV